MKKLLLGVVAVVGLGIAYWLVLPLFINETVDDALPVFTEADLMEMSAEMPDIVMDDDMPELTTKINFDTRVLYPQAPIIDTPGHPATGTVRILNTTMSGSPQIVRFENYSGTNGPDLFVYLAKDLEATEFINLGRTKGNMGNINYEVPADVDISEYKYVMTWCRLFGVLFDYAEIN